MADEDEISEGELEQEQEPEKLGLNYEELDAATGFKKVEWQIWQAFEEAVLNKPEDEKEEEEEWAETYAGDNNLDPNRVKAVIKLGLYAGPRDEFNQRTGEGKAIYNNGDTYEGQYWEGKKNGQGKYVYKSKGMSEVDKLLSELDKNKPGDESQEDFVARTSKGICVGPDIVRACLEHGFYACYSGKYVNNLKHGRGVSKNKDGSVYKGDWKDNKRDGEGVFYYLNGDIYSGQWEAGLKHGAGCYQFANGKGSYVGTWVKGNMTEGQWIMSDGNFYEGRFDAKNRPCDPSGVIKFPRADLVQQGEYKKGKWAPHGDLTPTADYERAQEAAAVEERLLREEEEAAAAADAEAAAAAE